MNDIRKHVKLVMLADGRRRVTLELDKEDEVVIVRRGAHYALGQPVGDVVPAHVITEAAQVTWCCVEQKWSTS
jgi:hypothetical protein